MNYTYKKVLAKHKALNAAPVKILTKIFVYGFKAIIFLLIFGIAVGGFAALGMFKGMISNAPAIEDINIIPLGYKTSIYDSKGTLIDTLIASGSNRSPVSISEIPEHLRWAFIDIEDERFYSHKGIDVKGIIRAGVRALTTRSLSEGASTITQQLLKNNVFENGGVENNLGALIKRKVQEQYLALELEKTMNKDIILQNYLNTINLGAGCFGVQAASKRYFNKNVSELTISESAVIAAITQSPYYLNPIRYSEKNSGRRAKILKNMRDRGHITDEEYDTAINDDVYSRINAVNDAYIETDTAYSYFVDELIDRVLYDLQKKKGYSYNQAVNALYSGGLSIYTTQDSAMQSICDEEMARAENYPKKIQYSFDWRWSVKHADGTIDNYSNININYYYKTLLGNQKFKIIFNSREEAQACIDTFKTEYFKEGDISLGENVIFTPQPQASFTVMDQHTGYVKAIVGGRGEKITSRSLNRATDSLRQPGSCFKVLAVFAPAIDRLNYTLASVDDDAPYKDVNGRSISNWWGESYRGISTFREAIYDSMNIIAMKTLTSITPRLGAEYINDFGITSLTDVDGQIQSLALGGITKGVSNIELCAAYAAIANKGVYTNPIYYTKILDHSGRILLENEPETHAVIKESTAFLLTSAMHDVISVGTGGAANVAGQYVAGKTGTTSNTIDLWFAGYTTHLTGVIWSGYDENQEMTNGTYHSKMWSTIMTRIHNTLGYSTINDPEAYEASNAQNITSIVEADVCKKSGKLPIEGLCDNDPQGSMIIKEYFDADNVPTDTCSTHAKYTICSISGKIANEYCPDGSKVEKIYRLRIPGNDGTTADTPYAISSALANSICVIHHE